MPHCLPFPSGRVFLLHVALLIILVSTSHCQKKDETPPPPKASEAPSSVPQPHGSPGVRREGPRASTRGRFDRRCEVVANPDLKGRMGRLIIQFPGGGKAGDTRVDVFHPVEQKALGGGYGNQTVTLLPGIYDVDISKKRLPSVPVTSGHDTRVKVGLLHVSTGKDTRIDILDAGKKLTGGYGNQAVGLPVGAFHVQVAGQAEGVTIEDGKVTEF